MWALTVIYVWREGQLVDSGCDECVGVGALCCYAGTSGRGFAFRGPTWRGQLLQHS